MSIPLTPYFSNHWTGSSVSIIHRLYPERRSVGHLVGLRNKDTGVWFDGTGEPKTNEKSGATRPSV